MCTTHLLSVDSHVVVDDGQLGRLRIALPKVVLHAWNVSCGVDKPAGRVMLGVG